MGESPASGTGSSMCSPAGSITSASHGLEKDDGNSQRPRLQRQLGQSRKTFRIRKSRRQRSDNTGTSACELDSPLSLTDIDSSISRHGLSGLRTSSIDEEKELTEQEVENKEKGGPSLLKQKDALEKSDLAATDSEIQDKFGLEDYKKGVSTILSSIDKEKLELEPILPEGKEQKSKFFFRKDSSHQDDPETGKIQIHEYQNYPQTFLPPRMSIQRQKTVSSVAYSSEKTEYLKKRRHSEASASKTVPFRRSFMERQEALLDSDLYETPGISSYERVLFSQGLWTSGDSRESVSTSGMDVEKSTTTISSSKAEDTKSSTYYYDEICARKMLGEESPGFYSHQQILSSTPKDPKIKVRKIGLAGISAPTMQIPSSYSTEKYEYSEERKEPIQFIRPRTQNLREILPSETQFIRPRTQDHREVSGSETQFIRPGTQDLREVSASETQFIRPRTQDLREVPPSETQFIRPRTQDLREALRSETQFIRTRSRELHGNETQDSASTTREELNDPNRGFSGRDIESPIISSGTGLPEGARRFVVDKFTVTFTEKDDEEDTLI